MGQMIPYDIGCFFPIKTSHVNQGPLFIRRFSLKENFYPEGGY
jgi:hypothetical protein